MAQINLLEQSTIDKIAAGEVVERPASVVKELVENAIDAGAGAITVELKDGGLSLIRVTDNGSGIVKDQVARAFLRHATSKIHSVEDLSYVTSLGFRGEALSSIAAVAQVELITKTAEDLTGVHYTIEGGREGTIEEIGAPNGTTMIARNLFFNTPARKKFLKSSQTEAGYVSALMEYMALSHADISFKYMINGQVRFHTSGNGDLKEIIYRIYGKDAAEMLVPVNASSPSGDISVSGYLTKPEFTRSNRSFEIYFINGRYIKSSMIARALEEGYKPFLMQHKFPFVVLHIQIHSHLIDVNVHPTKMEVRITNEAILYDFLRDTILAQIRSLTMIPEVRLVKEETPKEKPGKIPEPFENNRFTHMVEQESAYRKDNTPSPTLKMQDMAQAFGQNKIFGVDNEAESSTNAGNVSNIIKASDHIIVEKPVQMSFFENSEVQQDSRQDILEDYEILGQLFQTYWLLAYRDKLLIVDQHAAHEKVKFEHFMAELSQKKVQSQMMNPPIVVTLSGKEEATLQEYLPYFASLGFEIDTFGDGSYAIRSVPTDLYGCQEQELFLEILDELADLRIKNQPDVIERKIASMSCKAAVKGNMQLSHAELRVLMSDLMKLENPYQCPHGRPTIISMSKFEIEKKFKRII